MGALLLHQMQEPWSPGEGMQKGDLGVEKEGF